MSTPPPFSAFDRQKERYLADFMGTKPVVSPNLATLEAAAQAQMSTEAFAYIAGGAGLESTITANRTAFARWQIVPRMLRDVFERDIRTQLLGQLLWGRYVQSLGLGCHGGLPWAALLLWIGTGRPSRGDRGRPPLAGRF